MNLLDHNRRAWNHEVQRGNQWTIPAGPQEIEAARAGQFTILLTPTKPVPAAWLGDVRGQRVLCLASGGGQQGPLLAAAGAQVTVFDLSDEQLNRDRQAAQTYDLPIQTVQGNMQNLGCFAGDSFDLIVHPISNCFIDDIRPVWREGYRVLRAPGSLLAGFVNPLVYLVNWEEAEQTGRCEIKNAIPYSDLASLSADAQAKYRAEHLPFEFGHSLTDQIQGQLDAGFLLAGFYEDQGEPLLDPYTAAYIATRSVKR